MYNIIMIIIIIFLAKKIGGNLTDILKYPPQLKKILNEEIRNIP